MGDKETFILTFSGIFCVVGIIFLLVFWAVLSESKRKAQTCKSKASGTVTDLIWKSSGNPRHSCYYPVIEFTTARGEVISKQSPYGTNPPKYEIGQEVYVLYNSQKPEEFYIPDDKTRKIVQIVFGCVGGGLLFIGALVGVLVWFLA